MVKGVWCMVEEESLSYALKMLQHEKQACFIYVDPWGGYSNCEFVWVFGETTEEKFESFASEYQ